MPSLRFEILVGDVSESQTMEQAVTLAVRKWGGLGLLVNNAGIGADGEFEDVPPEAFDRVVDVNFKGVVNGCRSAWPTFRQQGREKIINVSSLAGILLGGLMTSYSSSKWAVTGFTTKKWSTYLEHPQNQRKPGRFPQAEACLPAIRRMILKEADYRPYAKTTNLFMMYIF